MNEDHLDPDLHLWPAEPPEWAVRSRKEMQYVNLVDLRTYRPPKGTAHFHVYVVADNSHPAARY